jgi:hypothetical protein
MTRNQRERDDESNPMRDVSHTNPYTNESMGSVFEHGVTIVADGGRRGAADDETDRDADADPEADGDEADEETDRDATPMRDVSHEAPEGGHGNRMFERVGDTADVVDEE